MVGVIGSVGSAPIASIMSAFLALPGVMLSATFERDGGRNAESIGVRRVKSVGGFEPIVLAASVSDGALDPRGAERENIAHD